MQLLLLSLDGFERVINFLVLFDIVQRGLPLVVFDKVILPLLDRQLQVFDVLLYIVCLLIKERVLLVPRGGAGPLLAFLQLFQADLRGRFLPDVIRL